MFWYVSVTWTDNRTLCNTVDGVFSKSSAALVDPAVVSVGPGSYREVRNFWSIFVRKSFIQGTLAGHP